MQKVNSFDTLDAFFKKYFLKNTLTNNYVLAETYHELINKEQLYFFDSNSNLILLVEKPNFFQLYFFINNLNEQLAIHVEKPITMEILYRGTANKPIELINFWERNGFKQHLTRDNLSLSLNKLNHVVIKNNHVLIKYAESNEESIAIKSLFESSLDLYTGDSLSLDEINEFINKKNVICAYIDNQFCGALQFEIKNNIIWLGHIVTDLNYRGNGIANLLVKKYIEDNAINPNSRYQLWVIDDNIAAKSLYTKFGFIYSNKSTTSLLKL
jgi:ribosomal protein S18 acetylase RimI-like enzyme